MILTVKPTAALKGTVRLPASKSYSIRAFLIASCGGRSKIIAPSDCEDAMVAMHAAKMLGTQIIPLRDNVWEAVACQRKNRFSKINVKESGTVLRFLLPLLARQGRDITVVGEGTLKGRPNAFLTRTLRKMGIKIWGEGRKESVPIRMKAGRLKAGRLAIDGSLSSQFISALLIICPQLREDTLLVLTGRKLVSTDYIVMTRQVLKESGINIQKLGERRYLIKGNQEFKGLKRFVVPSDYGLAAFLMGAAALTQSNVTLKGFFKDDLAQADAHIFRLLKRMGVRLQKSAKAIKIKGPFRLQGGDFSLKDCPDLVPIMAVLALFAEGRSRLYDIQHVRSKESDRIRDLRREFSKIGAKTAERANELVIEPQREYRRHCLLDPHRDHRLAMALCVLGLKLGARIQDVECVKKSYPGFVRDLKAVGADVSS